MALEEADKVAALQAELAATRKQFDLQGSHIDKLIRANRALRSGADPDEWPQADEPGPETTPEVPGGNPNGARYKPPVGGNSEDNGNPRATDRNFLWKKSDDGGAPTFLLPYPIRADTLKVNGKPAKIAEHFQRVARNVLGPGRDRRTGNGGGGGP